MPDRADSPKVLLHWSVVARRTQERGTDGRMRLYPENNVRQASPVHAPPRGRCSPGVDVRRAGGGAGRRSASGWSQKGPIVAWIVDDTGFAKKGTHSVGRNASAVLSDRVGKQENCRGGGEFVG